MGGCLLVTTIERIVVCYLAIARPTFSPKTCDFFKFFRILCGPVGILVPQDNRASKKKLWAFNFLFSKCKNEIKARNWLCYSLILCLGVGSSCTERKEPCAVNLPHTGCPGSLTGWHTSGRSHVVVQRTRSQSVTFGSALHSKQPSGTPQMWAKRPAVPMSRKPMRTTEGIVNGGLSALRLRIVRWRTKDDGRSSSSILKPIQRTTTSLQPSPSETALGGSLKGASPQLLTLAY